MMKRMVLGLLIASASHCMYGQDLEQKHQVTVNKFIDNIEKARVAEIASSIVFPFEREYPIPSIKTKQEFIQRFDEMFDDVMVKKITQSNAAKDWTALGWRGIMLNDGDLWLSYEGNLIGLNYQSSFEKKSIEKFISDDTKNIHASLSDYYRPVCVLKTATHIIRIDALADAEFRYASWPIGGTMADKPDLVINKGEYSRQGSGGNHRYQFKNSGYIYEFFFNVMEDEDDSGPVVLNIYNAGKKVKTQKASQVQP